MLPKFLKKIKPKDTPRKSRRNVGTGWQAERSEAMTPPRWKKAVIVVLLLVLLFPLFAQPAQAFFTPKTTYPFQFWNAVFQTDEMNLQSFVYETFKATLWSAFTYVFTCLSCSPGQAETGGLISLSRMIAAIYDSPPASGVEYLAYLGRELDLIPPTYAQAETAGEGFSRLDIVMPIWQAFRNIAYVFFVLILVFIGFAIMFRIKISPQAVISIQSALPRVILGLVLITFSYAIVGLLVDLMLVISNLIITIFNKNLPIHMEDALLNLPANVPVTSSLSLGWTMLIVGLLPILGTFALLILVIASTTIIGTLAGPGGALAGAAVGLGFGGLIAVLVALIFLWALIRVFWSLLKAYISVILALIFGPFQILIGTIPGSPAIGSWFKNLLANLAVFPTILTLVYLAGFLCLNSIGKIVDSLIGDILRLLLGENIVATVLIRSIVENLEGASLSEIGTLAVFFFVSIGILLMAPKAADMIKAFMSGQPFGYGMAIGEAFGAGIMYGGYAAEQVGKGEWPAPVSLIPERVRPPTPGGTIWQRGMERLSEYGKSRKWPGF